MKGNAIIIILVVLPFLTGYPVLAQEEIETEIEESAEVFLEEYTDEFQEIFFEALKQKGIQNYDRTINLLLECKGLDPINSALDHELARAYQMNKQYAYAKSYAIDAVDSEPQNYWYLSTLVDVLELQSEEGLQAVENAIPIPFSNKALQRNLAVIYFQKEKYTNALNILEGMQNDTFASNLRRRINDSLNVRNNRDSSPAATAKDSDETSKDFALEEFKNTIEQLLVAKDYNAALERSQVAKEAYPLQPYFYYTLGRSLAAQGKHKNAIPILEEGLEYLFDDEELANTFYKELANAFKAVGDMTNANRYLSKIKTGL